MDAAAKQEIQPRRRTPARSWGWGEKTAVPSVLLFAGSEQQGGQQLSIGHVASNAPITHGTASQNGTGSNQGVSAFSSQANPAISNDSTPAGCASSSPQNSTTVLRPAGSLAPAPSIGTHIPLLPMPPQAAASGISKLSTPTSQTEHHFNVLWSPTTRPQRGGDTSTSEDVETHAGAATGAVVVAASDLEGVSRCTSVSGGSVLILSTSEVRVGGAGVSGGMGAGRCGADSPPPWTLREDDSYPHMERHHGLARAQIQGAPEHAASAAELSHASWQSAGSTAPHGAMRPQASPASSARNGDADGDDPPTPRLAHAAGTPANGQHGITTDGAHSGDADAVPGPSGDGVAGSTSPLQQMLQPWLQGSDASAACAAGSRQAGLGASNGPTAWCIGEPALMPRMQQHSAAAVAVPPGTSLGNTAAAAAADTAAVPGSIDAVAPAGGRPVAAAAADSPAGGVDRYGVSTGAVEMSSLQHLPSFTMPAPPHGLAAAMGRHVAGLGSRMSVAAKLGMAEHGSLVVAVHDRLSLLLHVASLVLDVAVLVKLIMARFGPALVAPMVVCMIAHPIIMALVLLVHNHWASLSAQYFWALVTHNNTVFDEDWGSALVNRVLRQPLQLFMMFFMGLFAVVITVYCLVCFLMAAALSLLLLDTSMVLATLAPAGLRAFVRPSDLLYLENYKLARTSLHAIVESTAQIALVAAALVAWNSLPKTKAIISTAGGSGDEGHGPRVTGLLAGCLVAAVLNLLDKIVCLITKAAVQGVPLNGEAEETAGALLVHLRDIVTLKGAYRVPQTVIDASLCRMMSSPGVFTVGPEQLQLPREGGSSRSSSGSLDTSISSASGSRSGRSIIDLNPNRTHGRRPNTAAAAAARSWRSSTAGAAAAAAPAVAVLPDAAAAASDNASVVVSIPASTAMQQPQQQQQQQQRSALAGLVASVAAAMRAPWVWLVQRCHEQLGRVPLVPTILLAPNGRDALAPSQIAMIMREAIARYDTRSINAWALQYNGVNHSLPLIIADGLNRFTALSHLTISKCKVGGRQFRAVGAALAAHPCLATLRLSHVAFDANVLDAICLALESSSSLVLLEVVACGLTSRGATRIAKSLKAHYITGPGALQYATAAHMDAKAGDDPEHNAAAAGCELVNIQKHAKQQAATGVSSPFSKDQQQQPQLRNYRRHGQRRSGLQHLNLSSNAGLGKAGVLVIAEALPHCPRLAHLNLCFTKMGPAGATALADALMSAAMLCANANGNAADAVSAGSGAAAAVAMPVSVVGGTAGAVSKCEVEVVVHNGSGVASAGQAAQQQQQPGGSGGSQQLLLRQRRPLGLGLRRLAVTRADVGLDGSKALLQACVAITATWWPPHPPPPQPKQPAVGPFAPLQPSPLLLSMLQQQAAPANARAAAAVQPGAGSSGGADPRPLLVSIFRRPSIGAADAAANATSAAPGSPSASAVPACASRTTVEEGNEEEWMKGKEGHNDHTHGPDMTDVRRTQDDGSSPGSPTAAVGCYGGWLMARGHRSQHEGVTAGGNTDPLTLAVDLLAEQQGQQAAAAAAAADAPTHRRTNSEPSRAVELLTSLLRLPLAALPHGAGSAAAAAAAAAAASQAPPVADCALELHTAAGSVVPLQGVPMSLVCMEHADELASETWCNDFPALDPGTATTITTQRDAATTGASPHKVSAGGGKAPLHGATNGPPDAADCKAGCASGDEDEVDELRLFLCCTGDAGEAVCQAPCLVPALTSLDLSGMALCGKGIRALADSIREVPGALVALRLADTGLTQESLMALLPALETAPRLSLLDVSRNPLGDEAGIALTAHLQRWLPPPPVDAPLSPSGAALSAVGQPSEDVPRLSADTAVGLPASATPAAAAGTAGSTSAAPTSAAMPLPPLPEPEDGGSIGQQAAPGAGANNTTAPGLSGTGMLMAANAVSRAVRAVSSAVPRLVTAPAAMLTGTGRTGTGTGATTASPPATLTIRINEPQFPMALSTLRDLHVACMALNAASAAAAAGTGAYPVRRVMVEVAGVLPATGALATAMGAPVVTSLPMAASYAAGSRPVSAVTSPAVSRRTSINGNGGAGCGSIGTLAASSLLPAGQHRSSSQLQPGAAAAATLAIPPLPAGAGSAVAAGGHHRRGLSMASDASDVECGCGVCFDAPNTLTMKPCSHKICVACYTQLLRGAATDRRGVAVCPFCRATVVGYAYRPMRPCYFSTLQQPQPQLQPALPELQQA